MLSQQSGETGKRIAEKVGVISAAIVDACSVVRASVRQEDGSMVKAEASIGHVLSGCQPTFNSLEARAAEGRRLQRARSRHIAVPPCALIATTMGFSAAPRCTGFRTFRFDAFCRPGC